MGREEMEKSGISGCRADLAMKLNSKVHDITMLIFTIIFALAALIYLLTEDINAHSLVEKNIVHKIENL